MKTCFKTSNFSALVWAFVGLSLAAQQTVAFTRSASKGAAAYSRPKASMTTPKAATLAASDATVQAAPKRQSVAMQKNCDVKSPRQGKYRVRYGQSMTRKIKAPIVDVEPPLSKQSKEGELVSAIGMNPADMRPWATLGQGSSLSGEVVKVLPYGFLVQTKYDIPSNKAVGVALLHHPNIPDGMEQELKLGTFIENARVIKVNRQQGTVNLSLKPARRDVAPHLTVGEQVDAKVVKIVPYGAFLDIGHPQRQALLHVSRMSVYKVHDITDHVELGQTVKARIIHLSDNDIGVSILSKENDAFVDRRQLQSKRMDLWRQVVRGDQDEEQSARAKQELLEVDRQLWEILSDYMDTPRTSEV